MGSLVNYISESRFTLEFIYVDSDFRIPDTNSDMIFDIRGYPKQIQISTISVNNIQIQLIFPDMRISEFVHKGIGSNENLKNKRP